MKFGAFRHGVTILTRVLCVSTCEIMVAIPALQAANYDADDSSASAYVGGWGVSAPEWSLDGTIFTGGGLGGWSLRADPNASVRIDSVSSLGSGASLDAGGRSFRLSGGWYEVTPGNWTQGYAHAKRYLDPSGLDVGQNFSFRMAVNYRNGNKGVDLFDTNGAKIFNFNVGGDDYVVNVAASGTGSIGNNYSNDTVLEFRFEQTTSSGGVWKIIRTGGVNSMTEGTYSGVVRSVEWYAGGTDNNNPDALFFNNLVIGPYRVINLAVDMSAKINKGVFVPSSHGLEVKGSFNNWGSGMALTDPDGDQIYTASILYPGAPGDSLQYRMYATGTGASGLTWENPLPASVLSGTSNRSITLGNDGMNQTIPRFYFGDDDGVGPVITRNGEATINLQQNASYSDAGATATDAIEGSCVVTTSISSATLSTFTQTPGTYTVTYNASDAAGNAATPVTRTVVVAAAVPADSSFAGWLGSNMPSADLLKLYAFGAPSPTGSVSRSNLPSGSMSNSNLVLSYYVRANATNTNLVTPQWHTNLMLSNSWTPVDGANIATVDTNTNAYGVAVIQKTATVPVDNNSRKFLRLKVSE